MLAPSSCVKFTGSTPGLDMNCCGCGYEMKRIGHGGGIWIVKQLHDRDGKGTVVCPWGQQATGLETGVLPSKGL